MSQFNHPAFDHYRQWLTGDRLPGIELLNAWACQVDRTPAGESLRFLHGQSSSAMQYETRIAEAGEVLMRPGSVHDIFNALVWLAFPRTKTALNAQHVTDRGNADGRRSRRRDAVTLLDESGLIVACADATCAALLRAHAWRDLFVGHREDVVTKMRFVACGHGLLAKMIAPFRAITGRALLVPTDLVDLPDDATGWARIDSAAARLVEVPDFGTSVLLPLPVAAVPGWDVERLGERLFDDVSVFRHRVLR